MKQFRITVVFPLLFPTGFRQHNEKEELPCQLFVVSGCGMASVGAGNGGDGGDAGDGIVGSVSGADCWAGADCCCCCCC